MVIMAVASSFINNVSTPIDVIYYFSNNRGYLYKMHSNLGVFFKNMGSQWSVPRGNGQFKRPS